MGMTVTSVTGQLIKHEDVIQVDMTVTGVTGQLIKHEAHHIDTIVTCDWNNKGQSLLQHNLLFKYIVKISYKMHYPVVRSVQSTLHFTPWQTCSTKHHLNFSGKYSATLHLTTLLPDRPVLPNTISACLGSIQPPYI